MMWLDDFCRDVRYSLRAMARRPGFAVMAILTLALGIGANTAIFVLLDAVILKPLAVPAADELITLYETGPGVADTAGGTGRFLRFSHPRFQRLAAAHIQDACGIRHPQAKCGWSSSSFAAADKQYVTIAAGSLCSCLGYE